MSLITSVNDHKRVIEHQYTVCTTQTVVGELHIYVQYCPQITGSCQNVCTRQDCITLFTRCIHINIHVQGENEINFNSHYSCQN